MTHLTLTEVEALARAAHAGQTDKAGRPYAEHLQAVADGVRAAAAATARSPPPGCTTPSRTTPSATGGWPRPPSRRR